ncbi:glycosyltransferase family 2 protein [Actibacterium sp. XHP0104]|uniref:glycosyltransferase family 2 protein n=1 Tax=Actibacterium sp. XHP0104 TaxID=2984335 RepID=UPI0021E8FF09|nr:glycosyltransferase family 2 protein [Actibacterium sp. XHP0104]MCV2883051.1 glycosyltransferase family 2 protein [Actibacterium sp. XHP0104]
MLVGVSVVKNEEDIIEAMLRHNLRYLDKILVIDNGSSDKTPEIVENLQLEGLACTLQFKPGVDHRQHEILTDALETILKTENPLRVFPLDADEFILADAQDFRTEMEGPTVLSLPWVTYVPTASDDRAIRNPIERIRHRLEHEPNGRSKVTVPAAYLGNARLSKGSHRLFDADGSKVKSRASRTARLAHFPLRSEDQLMAKALIGSWSVRYRNGRVGKRGGEARQWHDMAELILAGGALGPDDLTRAAVQYGGASSQDVPLVDDPIDPAPKLNLTPERDKNTVLHSVIQYTNHLVEEVIRLRQG